MITSYLATVKSHPLEKTFLLRYEAWELVLMLFAAMIICILLGIFIGKRFYKEYEKEGTVQGALFAILGLLLAFTFSMSVSRYDKRIDIIIEEANDIGTAVLRADLYPEAERQLFRADFKRYVEARIAYFDAGADVTKMMDEQRQASEIAQQLWNRASQLSSNPGHHQYSLYANDSCTQQHDRYRQYTMVYHAG